MFFQRIDCWRISIKNVHLTAILLLADKYIHQNFQTIIEYSNAVVGTCNITAWHSGSSPVTGEEIWLSVPGFELWQAHLSFAV